MRAAAPKIRTAERIIPIRFVRSCSFMYVSCNRVRSNKKICAVSDDIPPPSFLGRSVSKLQSRRRLLGLFTVAIFVVSSHGVERLISVPSGGSLYLGILRSGLRSSRCEALEH